MTSYFQAQGISCRAVISGTVNSEQQALVTDRETAISELKTGKLAVIFSVDMFNEGLDIPELDMVLFLRPTQSPIVFLQQLGRGLRKSRGKSYVNVLDFIGNYKKANLLPFLLTSEAQPAATGRTGFRLPREDDYPVDCLVDFDFQLIDLFKKMAGDQKKISDRVVDEFYRIQDQGGRRLGRLDFYVHLDESLLDGSEGCCKLAEAYIGQSVLCQTFAKLDFDGAFDGVWACASLLHVPYAQLPVIFRKVARALKAGGYLYASFKYGDFEGERNGRYFTDLDEGRLAAVMQPVAGLTIVETFVTGDVRDGRGGEKWLNVIGERR